MEDFKALLLSAFAPYGELTLTQLALLERHYQLLLRWNERMNLTRITAVREAVLHHYCESLYLARSLPPGKHMIVDVGSGAGFPGIPLAVYRPDCTVHLVEAHKRKAVFLTEAVFELRLENVRVLPVRAEDILEKYDWLVSRAVDPEAILHLKIAANVSMLANEVSLPGISGEALPWGRGGLFHVEQSV